MTPALFRTIGQALHGPAWKAAFADALEIHPKTVDRYATGKTKTIPASIKRKCRALVAAKAAEMRGLRKLVAP